MFGKKHRCFLRRCFCSKRRCLHRETSYDVYAMARCLKETSMFMRENVDVYMKKRRCLGRKRRCLYENVVYMKERRCVYERMYINGLSAQTFLRSLRSLRSSRSLRSLRSLRRVFSSSDPVCMIHRGNSERMRSTGM